MKVQSSPHLIYIVDFYGINVSSKYNKLDIYCFLKCYSFTPFLLLLIKELFCVIFHIKLNIYPVPCFS